MIRERSGWNLISGRIKVFHEVYCRFIPDRDHPRNIFFLAEDVDLGIFLRREFHFMTILQIGDVAPRRFTHLFLLFRRSRDLRRALLKFDRIHAGMNCGIYNLFGNLKIAIMIDYNFSDDIRGMSIAKHSISKFKLASHLTAPQVYSTPDHTTPSMRHNRPDSIERNPPDR